MSIDPPSFGAGKVKVFAHPEALSEPEKLLAAYFSASTVGLGILDSDLRFLAVNHKLAEINGIPPAEHLGKTVREVLGDFARVLEPEFHRVLSTREAVNVEISATLPTKTEPSHWLMQNLPVRDATGVVTRVGAVVVDITAQRKLEQSLQDVDRKLRNEMERLKMMLDVSAIVGSTSDLQARFPANLRAHSPRPASGIRRLRTARRQYRASGPPGGRLPLGQRIAFVPPHQHTRQSRRPRPAGGRPSDFLEKTVGRV